MKRATLNPDGQVVEPKPSEDIRFNMIYEAMKAQLELVNRMNERIEALQAKLKPCPMCGK